MAPIVPFIPAIIAAGVSAGATIGAAKLSKPDAPKAPPPPKVMPTADDAQIQVARSRRAAMARQQSGIASSMLSTKGARETLGG